jgi:hypothetical protein
MGSLPAASSGGHKKHLLAAHAEQVRQLVTAAPELTLAALCDRLAAEGIEVSISTLARFLKASGFSYKKPWPPPNNNAATCNAWQAGQPQLAASKLVCVDETWGSTNMTPGYGRAPLGQRLRGYAPHGHWQTITFLAALRYDRLMAILRPGEIVMMDNLAAHKVAGGPPRHRSCGRHPALSAAVFRRL